MGNLGFLLTWFVMVVLTRSSPCCQSRTIHFRHLILARTFKPAATQTRVFILCYRFASSDGLISLHYERSLGDYASRPGIVVACVKVQGSTPNVTFEERGRPEFLPLGHAEVASSGDLSWPLYSCPWIHHASRRDRKTLAGRGDGVEAGEEIC